MLALMFLGVMLIAWSGCGEGNNPTVTENTPTGDKSAVMNGKVAGVEGVPIHIQVLQNGEVIVSAKADADGNYQIDNIEPGTYTVQITAKGYETVERTGQVRADEVTSLDKDDAQGITNSCRSHSRSSIGSRDEESPYKRSRSAHR